MAQASSVMHEQADQSGFGLLETLVVIAIVTLLAGWAAPAYQRWVSTTAARSARSELRTLIAYARQNSVTSHRQLVLCGSSDGNHCDGQWQQYAILRTQRQDGAVQVLSRLEPDERIDFQGPHASRLFHPQPIKNMVNGTFRFCLSGSDAAAVPPNSLLLVVNNLGRTRSATLEADSHCNRE